MASINLSPGEAKWNEWSLLPGPTVLSPLYVYEHGNSNRSERSQPGSAGCESKAQLRDPRFLPYNDDRTKDLNGLLFYAVQGERAIASAEVYINLTSYHLITNSRNISQISSNIATATSLYRESDHLIGNIVSPVLITGSGRSGTTYLCSVFGKLGLNISHDNDIDCGPYPGSDGAVSWYDAFDRGRRYKRVLHIIRHPLAVIESRSTKIMMKKISSVSFMKKMLDGWEDTTDLDVVLETPNVDLALSYAYTFSLKHWVRINSFVHRHASWREKVEDVFEDAYSFWRLCVAAGFGTRCKNLVEIEKALKSTSPTLNSMGVNGTLSNVQKILGHDKIIREKGSTRKRLSWEQLKRLVLQKNTSLNEKDLEYTVIAQEMASGFGYIVPTIKSNASCRYDCNFRKSGDNLHWDCWLKTGRHCPR